MTIHKLTQILLAIYCVGTAAPDINFNSIGNGKAKLWLATLETAGSVVGNAFKSATAQVTGKSRSTDQEYKRGTQTKVSFDSGSTIELLVRVPSESNNPWNSGRYKVIHTFKKSSPDQQNDPNTVLVKQAGYYNGGLVSSVISAANPLNTGKIRPPMFLVRITDGTKSHIIGSDITTEENPGHLVELYNAIKQRNPEMGGANATAIETTALPKFIDEVQNSETINVLKSNRQWFWLPGKDGPNKPVLVGWDVEMTYRTSINGKSYKEQISDISINKGIELYEYTKDDAIGNRVYKLIQSYSVQNDSNLPNNQTVQNDSNLPNNQTKTLSLPIIQSQQNIEYVLVPVMEQNENSKRLILFSSKMTKQDQLKNLQDELLFIRVPIPEPQIRPI